jgi:NAD(P)-dependent dehydrogenase (short-subunit alcohol dehydrogenase family)
MGGRDKKKFDPDQDIPSLDGKVILVTGGESRPILRRKRTALMGDSGNGGIGKETVFRLAKHNATIFLCCRSISKGENAAKEIKAIVPEARIELLELDLSSFASIANGVSHFLSKTERLDILINNAGIFNVADGKTAEDYDVYFGTNYMGPALLTKLLLTTLSKTAEEAGSDVRIVNVSSAGHSFSHAKGINLEDTALQRSSFLTKYGQSKLGNVLHAKELARRYPQIITVSLHPGEANSGIGDDFRKRSTAFRVIYKILAPVVLGPVEQGAKNSLWCATVDRDAIESGAYYVPIGKKATGSKHTQDTELAQKLWEWTEAEFGKHGY